MIASMTIFSSLSIEIETRANLSKGQSETRLPVRNAATVSIQFLSRILSLLLSHLPPRVGMINGIFSDVILCESLELDDVFITSI